MGRLFTLTKKEAYVQQVKKDRLNLVETNQKAIFKQLFKKQNVQR
jgi:hypothetical protein